MPLELRSWINHQPYTNSYSTSGIAREASYFTTVPEPVTVDPEYVTAEAREYEAAGYDSSTVPQSATWPDVAATAAWALAATSRLSLVLAHRPGVQAPTAAARAIATLDRLSDGRTSVHLILGHGDLTRDGDFLDREERYARAAEYLDVFTGVLTRTEPFDYEGRYYRVEGAFSGVRPVQSPRPVLSIPGGSELGVDLAARYADVVAFRGQPLEAVGAAVAQARTIAATHGRDPGFWVNLNMVVGETDEAAWDHVRRLEDAVRTLIAYRGDGRSEVTSIREHRKGFFDADVPDVVDTALYLGLQRLGGGEATLVGSPSTIADAVLAYEDLGVSIITLGSHVTDPRDAELRAETLRLIKRAVAARDAVRAAA
ncbi:LLM class flavin-dependent oxidoreductase [Mumia sp. DW29H23]|uniref:LLM class flavin-dependent oxidoreductase n=1 Tax=Mumia sp. DW29H23 TaxID=3421241 RepID=UPI003D689450